MSFRTFLAMQDALLPAEPRRGQKRRKPTSYNNYEARRDVHYKELLRRCETQLWRYQDELRSREVSLRRRNDQLERCERTLRQCGHRLDSASEEIRNLTCTLRHTNEELAQKDETVRFYRKFATEHRSLQGQIKAAKRGEAEAKKRAAELESAQKQGESKEECDVPQFSGNDELLSDKRFQTFMTRFTKVVSKKRIRSISATQFVNIIYAPYYDEAFGKCYVPRIDEILDECHFDEVTEKVTCALSATYIKYVLQRLWDMGYHQAKDVVRGLEQKNVEYVDDIDGAWKNIIFGVEPGVCFVSGESQKGVGDHIQPVRANRHVTGCYGGNSKWNLASVISALNQPYKNMILFLPQQMKFVKICLDSAAFTNISFNFNFTAEQAKPRFNAYYNEQRSFLESRPVNCLVQLRNFYKNNANVQRLDGATLVKNVDHFFTLIGQAVGVSTNVLKSIVALPSCSQRAHIQPFWEALTTNPAAKEILNLLKATVPNLTLDVEQLFPTSGGIKKAYSAFWEGLKLTHVVKFLKSSNALKFMKWMQTKEDKKLYKKADALDIYMRLSLWKAYVSSVHRQGKVPKMEWKMRADEFVRIEEILKRGVQGIHDETKAFIEETI